MADENQTAEECPECVIDLSKLKNRPRGPASFSVLILLARGTYGRYDDGYSAIQVGNAVLASEGDATLVLLEDGVYFALREQDPVGIGYANNAGFIRDFLDLGGRVVAVRSALAARGLEPEDLFEGVEPVPLAQVARELARHDVAVTF
ncbi:MAG: DsrE family protein [Thermaerobacter sp.]|jgi:sulfur relay (sulfurtransferase) DsrF/TusC family protein|nr:DsrE family protein [Thermaerobacter sp.]